jgi:hypothetical protein
MSRKRFALGIALALMGLMASAPRADAAYTYTASLQITSVTGAAGVILNNPLLTVGTGASFTSNNGTVVTLGNITSPGNFLVGSPLSANFGNVGVTTTSGVAETFMVNYTIFGTLTDPAPGGPSFTAFTTGTLTFTGVQFSGGASAGTINNVFTGPFVVGPGTFPNGDTFTTIVSPVPNAQFASPTVNGKSGNVGGLIISSVVPEPSSMTLVGLGVAGIAGVSLRRRRS